MLPVFSEPLAPFPSVENPRRIQMKDREEAVDGCRYEKKEERGSSRLFDLHDALNEFG
jgi:hypothetical protein